MKKSKSLLSRITALALTVICSVSFLFSDGIIANALSSTEKATENTISDWKYNFSSSGLSNGYNISTGKYDDDQYKYAWAKQVPYFITSDGRYAYCLHLGETHTKGVTSSQKAFDEYIKTNSYISDEQANLIKVFNIYSYKGTTQYGFAKNTELCASVVMAQTISAKFFDSSSTSISSNELKVLKCYTYIGSSNTSTQTKQWNNLKNCYQKMKEEILSHYDIPSNFSLYATGKPLSNATYPLIYNSTSKKWTATISSNSTLSQFTVSTKIDGVTITKSGNKLEVSATDTGVKKLVNTAIKLTKTKGKYVNSIDECSAVILSGKNAQEMVSSNSGEKDPINAYVAFEMSTGDLKITKKINDNGEIKNANEYSYEYFDEKLNTNVKYTWDKSYKWDNSTSKWVEYKNAPTSNPTFSAGLRNIIRFKVKNSAGQYVVATESATGKYNFLSFLFRQIQQNSNAKIVVIAIYCKQNVNLKIA